MEYQRIEVNFEEITSYRTYLGVQLYERALARAVPKSVLEIGPGNGAVAKHVIENSWLKPQAFEFLEPDLKFAKDLTVSLRPKKVIPLDLESYLASENRSHNYDLTIANFSFHWIEEIHKYSDKIFQLMRENGILAIMNTNIERSFWSQIDQQVQDHFENCSLFGGEAVRSLKVNEWIELISSCGFHLKEHREYYGVAAAFLSPAVALESFKQATGVKYLNRASQNRKDEIEKFVLDQLSLLTGKEGAVPMSASAFQLLFQK